MSGLCPPSQWHLIPASATETKLTHFFATSLESSSSYKATPLLQNHLLEQCSHQRLSMSPHILTHQSLAPSRTAYAHCPPCQGQTSPAVASQAQDPAQHNHKEVQ